MKRTLKKMFIAIVDLERVYDTVSRGKLWKVPEEYTICRKLLTAIRALHDGSQAFARGESRMSQWFEVRQGVCQGCVQLNKIGYVPCVLYMLSSATTMIPMHSAALSACSV